jgi:hypothetical protein
MGRTPRLALAALTLFLVAFPLVLARPGVPSGLKADEPAYFAMALSLAHDGDLSCDLEDLRRVVEAFPFGSARNLILMSDDGWETVYFGKPYAYSLFAAPAAALAGAPGMIAFNMALLAGMIWLGAIYLARFNRGGLAALFSAGFFLVSAGFAYVFWIHPEIFNMAGVTLSLFLIFHRFGPPRPVADASRGWRRGWARARTTAWSPTGRAVLSGAALGLAVYVKPMLLAFALPALYLYGWRRRSVAGLAAWGAGLALSLGVLAGIAWGLTGHTTAYMGVARGSYEICDPDVMPVQPESVGLEDAPAAAGGTGEVAPDDGAEGDREVAEAPKASWAWILGLPDVPFHETVENVTYFFVGRHTGLLLYFPFAALSVLLFLLHDRRRGQDRGLRWANALALAAVAAFFLLWIPFNWHGGGGFVGNRYYVNAYPAFLFLVTRIAPAWSVLAGYLAGGVFLSSIVFTPLGRSVAHPTLQFHARNPPFRAFPLELSLRQLPGYTNVNLGSLQIRGREDQILPRGGAFWVRGADDAELWLQSLEPLGEVLFAVESLADGNRVRIEVGEGHEVVELDTGQGARVALAPGEPDRLRHSYGTLFYVYRMGVRTTTGEVQQFEARSPPERCTYFPYNAAWEDGFFAGARLTWLGAPDLLERDVFGVEWQGARVPWRAGAGGIFAFYSRLTNTSEATWPAGGAVRVNLSYHWLDAEGREVVREGMRSALPGDVPPGEPVAVRQEVLAPDRPGAYTLVLEPVYENVAWFSDRLGEAATVRARVRVVPAEAMAQPPGTPGTPVIEEIE